MAPRSLPLARGTGVRLARAGTCLAALLAVAALAGCGGGANTTPTGGATGHLYGTVTRWPTSPVCRPGVPCSAPASGAQLDFGRDGRTTRVVVAEDGSYSVSLPEGNYVVTVAPQSPVGRGIEPSMVLVVAGETRKRDFRIDTGIR